MTFDLQFGAVDLLATKNASPGYWFETYGDNMSLGSPQAVEKEITSFLMDGSIASIESWDDRELTLPVAICGTTVANLAAGEAALFAEIGIRNVLTYTPSGNGSPCVFDVVTSKPEVLFDDVLEMNAVKRGYTLTIEALPFARATADVTASWAAPPAGAPTVVTVDACTATTNWARTQTGSVTFTGPTVLSGAVYANGQNTTGSSQAVSLTLTRSSLAASMTTTPFVRVDYTSQVGNPSGGITPVPVPVTVKINGTVAAEVSSNGSVHWFAMPGGATTLASIAFTNSATAANSTTLVLSIADISRSSATSDVTGQRQTFRSVNIAGSARTQGSITLTDATPAALGSVLVYTFPTNAAVAQPPLRVFLTSGNAQTTDTSTISGKTSDLSGLHTFDIPVSQVPSGTYLLMGRVKNASAGTYSVTWTGRSRMGTTNLDSNPPTGVKSVTVAAATWTVAALGNMVLPTRIAGTAGLVRIELSGPSGLLLDEAWLFNLDTGRLTWLECGTGTPAAGGSASTAFLFPASLTTPVPQVTIGTASDGSDAYGAGSALQSFGDHEFLPGQMSVFTVSSNSVAMAGSVTYSPRYMTHVA